MTEKTGGRELLFLMTAEQAEAFARLVAAASRGDGAAACRLGDMCREGFGGLRFSPKQTYRWYAKSALAGDANGQNNLGACYEHGLGCVQSYVKAVKWYRLAAAQGLAYASSNLGYCYLHGHGVGMDKGEALAWFERALEQGDDRAKEMVEKLGGTVPPRRKVRFVDETEPGKHFGLVGVAGVAPQDQDAPGEEGIRRGIAESLTMYRTSEGLLQGDDSGSCGWTESGEHGGTSAEGEA